MPECRGPGLGGEWQGDVATWGLVRDVLNPIPGRVIDLERAGGGARALLTKAGPRGRATIHPRFRRRKPRYNPTHARISVTTGASPPIFDSTKMSA